jgi:antitoxin component YwqK of YwqJK toxin-antitoxin module
MKGVETSRGAAACVACGAEVYADRCSHCGTEVARSGGSSRRRLLTRVGAGVCGVGVLAAGVLVLLPRLQKPAATDVPVTDAATAPQGGASAKMGTPLDIACPADTTLVEDAKSRSRWCGQTNASGRPVRHGPFVSWDSSLDVIERSNYFDDKLHGRQVVHNGDKRVSEGQWRDGKKVGLWIWYGISFSDNGKEIEENYKDGVLEGPWRIYRYDGTVRDEGTYQNGLKQGVWSHYDGKVKTTEATYEKDKQHGPYTSWRSDDGTTSLYEKGAYAHGKKTGPWVTYHLNGQKEAEGIFDQDRPQGEWRTWHRNGTLATQGSYKEGVKVGPWVAWFANGQKEREGTFENGLPVGTTTQWYENGVKHSEIVRLADAEVRTTHWHANGKMQSYGVEILRSREGEWTTWYENGKKKSVEVYKQNYQQGIATTWHENGRKASEGLYAGGNRKGTWRWWTPTGKVERVQDFPRE